VGKRPTTNLYPMTYAERAQLINDLAASLSADQRERDRLKAESDESLSRFHRAVLDFSESVVTADERFAGAPPKARRT
jgi:hypothetical protein